MNKHPFTGSFLRSSLYKAMAPFTTTATTMSPIMTLHARIVIPLTCSTFYSTLPCTRSSLRIRVVSSFSSTSQWSSSIALFCLTILSLSILLLPIHRVDGAPHLPAPNRVVNAMGLTFSEDSAQPLQLQIEAQVAGTQKLAYLPTTGPSLDFYYLNYRPSYRAGESHIDFWMFTPQGAQAPKTGSLELLDEFGRIRLAVLVPEGTEIPEALANKHEPFLWKSWKIPKMIKSDFDFSEKFRVVLKTSDSLKATVAAAKLEKNKNQKRFDPDSESTLLDFLLVKGKNKHLEKKNEKSGSTNAKHVVPAAATAATGPLIVQDRQFRIKGLQAVPGGKPNPAKANINSLSATPAANQNNQGVITNKNDGNNDNPTNTAKSTTSSGLSSRTTLSRLVTTALAMFLAASASLW